jgi:glycosyltransferase involved in cell wall biosynthesis
MLFKSFQKVFDDDRINEIIIYDDCSKPELFTTVHNWVERINQNKNKIKLYQQSQNVGMSLNKYYSVLRASNEWCILFDSDNILDVDYIDAFWKFVVADEQPCRLKSEPEHNATIFCPEFAKPDFNYTKYSKFPGIYDAKSVSHLIKDDTFNCLMNTCNYIVNRSFYLKTYKFNPDHKASDTIWHNYNHLKASGIFAVVPDMHYYHRVHKESGFMQNINYNMQKAEEVRKLIMAL